MRNSSDNRNFSERSYHFPHLDPGNSWHGDPAAIGMQRVRSVNSLTISADSNLECAARLMREQNVGALDVCEGE
jgi:hypothetical protein